MRQLVKTTVAALMISSFAILAPVNSVAGTQDKMPITTSSEKALNYYLKAIHLTNNLRFQEARKYYDLAIAEDPNFALAYLQSVPVQQSPKSGLENFNKAKSLIDKVSKAEQLWILSYEAGVFEGDPQKSRNFLKEMVEAYPYDEQARNLLGTNYFGQQEWNLAIAEYEEAIAIKPDYAAVYNQLGYAYRFQNEFDKAALIFEKYIELIPNDPNPYDSYAELLMKMGKFDESIKQYKAALKVKPDFFFSHAGIASNLNFKGEHEAAQKQLQIMYDESVDDGQRRGTLTAMAWSYVDGGDFDKAVGTFQKRYDIAVKLADTTAMAGDLVLLGYTVIEVEGREKEALEYFQNATAMVQSSSVSDKIKKLNRHVSNFNIGRAYTAMGDIENAKKHAANFREVARAVQNGFQIKQSHQLDGLIALKEGNFDKAIKELMQTNLINPYNNFYLGKAFEAKGDIASAKEHYEEAGHCNSPNGGPQACVRTKALEQAAAL